MRGIQAVSATCRIGRVATRAYGKVTDRLARKLFG